MYLNKYYIQKANNIRKSVIAPPESKQFMIENYFSGSISYVIWSMRYITHNANEYVCTGRVCLPIWLSIDSNNNIQIDDELR